MQISSNISAEIKQRLEAAIPGAQIEVLAGSAGHYEIYVISTSFEGLSQLKQQQMIYAPIKDLMSGDDAPIHAIDRMDLRVS